MKQISLIIVLFTLFCFSASAQLQVDGYTNYKLAGFTVLVQNKALESHKDITNDAISLLEKKIKEILGLKIDSDKIDSLLVVPIFMDWDTTPGAAQYHPSKKWLSANNYLPGKAKCVEISNIKNFVAWTNQNQPYMVLHELAHAYHHRVLNNKSALITSAYKNAISNNLYVNISLHRGGGHYVNKPKAYALTNEKEYFAELTEAYFGLNDFFPFTYEELKKYDVKGFHAVQEVWGTRVN